jgi:hypothetical protein
LNYLRIFADEYGRISVFIGRIPWGEKYDIHREQRVGRVWKLIMLRFVFVRCAFYSLSCLVPGFFGKGK